MGLDVHREETLQFHRFTTTQRVMHAVLFSTFITVTCTAFPLKFWYLPWATPLIWVFGGPKVAGIVHRMAGVTMFFDFLFNLAYIGYTTYRKIAILKKEEEGKGVANMAKKTALLIYNLPIMPKLKDLLDVLDFAKYLFLISKEPPKYDKFCWIEKFDYFAVFWGIPVFVSTGPLFWFAGFFTSLGLPGWIINLAFIVHSDEAMLAVAVLFTWHFFNVHFAPEKLPMGTVWLTGYMSEADMIHEHMNDYVEIMTDKERFRREVLVLAKPSGSGDGHGHH